MSEPVHCRCGGEAEIFHIAPEEGYEGSYCVRCTECLIQTPFFNKDKDKAIEVWNMAMSERTAKVVHKQQTYIVTPPKSTTIAYETKTNLWDECGNCGAMGMYHGWKYCPNCGVKLEWSGNDE